MSEDAPKIVRLETSLELSDFLSEAEFPPEAGFQSEPEVMAQAASSAATESAAGHDTPDEPHHLVTASLDPAAAESAATVPAERAPVAHVGPATVTEFPARQQTPPAVALASLPNGPVTLVELIERRGGFEWREAVAVIHQICLHLKDHAAHAPILLDPRNIQINDKGEVLLLSGQTSSDPLVVQVGRLLRTMLMGKEAPPELRLLLAQATFELPIFESIEDVDRALAQLNKLDEPGPAGPALLRAVAAPPSPPTHDDDIGNRPPSIRSILPAQRRTAHRPRSRTAGLRSTLGSHGSHVAIIFAAVAGIGGLLLTRPAVLFPSDAAPATKPQIAPVAIAPAAPAAADRSPAPAATPAPTGALGTPPVVRQPPPAALPSSSVAARPLEGRVGRHRPEPSPSGPAATAGVVAAPPATVKPRAAGTSPSPAPTTPPAPSPRDSERRATSLLALGQTAEASMAFDALVMSNPLYEPRATDLTPEALAAFRTSQRLLLPVIAQRNYDRARAALAAGDPDQALAVGKETAAILDRRLADTPARLREQVGDLIEQASTAAAAANEIIYTEADAGVIPPRPLIRQMPVNGPLGVPPNRVGWLDMVINRDGSVYSVKLHTPLNRHHERMIVSPAKAWRYRPATRNGRPVMYRILVKVNLPESGTE